MHGVAFLSEPLSRAGQCRTKPYVLSVGQLRKPYHSDVAGNLAGEKPNPKLVITTLFKITFVLF